MNMRQIANRLQRYDYDMRRQNNNQMNNLSQTSSDKEKFEDIDIKIQQLFTKTSLHDKKLEETKENIKQSIINKTLIEKESNDLKTKIKELENDKSINKIQIKTEEEGKNTILSGEDEKGEKSMIKENNKSPNLIQNYKNSIINNNINNININNYSRIKDDILLPNNKFLSEEITKKMLTPQLYTSLKIGNETNTEQNIQNQKIDLKNKERKQKKQKS